MFVISKCECGCAKVYGAEYGNNLHSDWCPWSPNYTGERDTFTACEGYECPNEAVKWAQFYPNGPLVNYCAQCWQATVFSNQGVHDYGPITT